MEDAHVPILHQLFATHLMKKFVTGSQSLSQVSVLDLGCGRGEQLAYMKRLGFQMSGCDIRKDYVESTISGLDGLDYTNTDIRLSKSSSELPFESGQFHAVYANAVFEHSAEMPPLIGEISRVLAPGGIFLTAFPLRSVVVEPHLKLPFVHWFSIGRSQRLLIRVLANLCHHQRSCQSIERYLRDEVFYWTSAQVRQILHRHFESINSLAKEYLMIAKSQENRSLSLRVGLSATKVQLISSILESLLSSQWTCIVEASNPLKR
ncbi:MAG TPA: class I SAM-dependent methyltransferase [Nitrospira sp.]|nr:class I SAM-dependent methyltransferase [Nitrospira sp.]